MRRFGASLAPRACVGLAAAPSRALATTVVPDVGTPEFYDDLLRRARELQGWTVSLRRRLHAHPELMYQEERTSAVIRETLDGIPGVAYTPGWARNTRPDFYGPGPGGHGVVAEIGSGGSPCVALRGDMDALPIHEATPGVDAFRSQVAGRMHACGHDAHTAMLLGAARLLAGLSAEGRLPGGTVRLLFQPAEEGGAGAKRMVEEGALRQLPPVERCFGFHVWPSLPSGAVGGRPGCIMAASDKFDLTLSGVGGHAAMPHLCADPVVAAAALVTQLQTLVSRNVAPSEPAVASVTKVAGGDAYNVIPARVDLAGTLRSTSEATLHALRAALARVAEGTAAAHGCHVARLRFAPDPTLPTINDPTLWRDFAAPHAAMAAMANGFAGGVTELDAPSLAGEDFSFFAAEVPSAFLFLGQGGGGASGQGGEEGAHGWRQEAMSAAGVAPEGGAIQQEGRGGGGGGGGGGRNVVGGQQLDTSKGLHHPEFALDESVLATGVALHAHLAAASLKDLQRGAA